MVGIVREVKVNVGYTFNTAPYESLRLDASETRDVLPGEEAEAVYAEAFKSAQTQLFLFYHEFMNAKEGGTSGVPGQVGFLPS